MEPRARNAVFRLLFHGTERAKREPALRPMLLKLVAAARVFPCDYWQEYMDRFEWALRGQ